MWKARRFNGYQGAQGAWAWLSALTAASTMTSGKLLSHFSPSLFICKWGPTKNKRCLCLPGETEFWSHGTNWIPELVLNLLNWPITAHLRNWTSESQPVRVAESTSQPSSSGVTPVNMIEHTWTYLDSSGTCYWDGCQPTPTLSSTTQNKLFIFLMVNFGDLSDRYTGIHCKLYFCVCLKFFIIKIDYIFF